MYERENRNVKNRNRLNLSSDYRIENKSPTNEPKTDSGYLSGGTSGAPSSRSKEYSDACSPAIIDFQDLISDGFDLENDYFSVGMSDVPQSTRLCEYSSRNNVQNEGSDSETLCWFADSPKATSTQFDSRIFPPVEFSEAQHPTWLTDSPSASNTGVEDDPKPELKVEHDARPNHLQKDGSDDDTLSSFSATDLHSSDRELLNRDLLSLDSSPASPWREDPPLSRSCELGSIDQKCETANKLSPLSINSNILDGSEHDIESLTGISDSSIIGILDSPQSTVVKDNLDSPQSTVVKDNLDSPQSTVVKDNLDSPQSTVVKDNLDSPQSTVVKDNLDSPQSTVVKDNLDSPSMGILGAPQSTGVSEASVDHCHSLPLQESAGPKIHCPSKASNVPQSDSANQPDISPLSPVNTDSNSLHLSSASHSDNERSDVIDICLGDTEKHFFDQGPSCSNSTTLIPSPQPECGLELQNEQTTKIETPLSNVVCFKRGIMHTSTPVMPPIKRLKFGSSDLELGGEYDPLETKSDSRDSDENANKMVRLEEVIMQTSSEKKRILESNSMPVAFDIKEPNNDLNEKDNVDRPSENLVEDVKKTTAGEDEELKHLHLQMKPMFIEEEPDRERILEKGKNLEIFISKNEDENKDNFDPEWEVMKKLNSDDERYKVVRKLWMNIHIPDLKKLHASFSWRRMNSLPLPVNNPPMNDYDVDPSLRKKYFCTEVFDIAINKLHDFVENRRRGLEIDEVYEHAMVAHMKRKPAECEGPNGLKSYQLTYDQLHSCYQERMHRYEQAKKEIDALHAFYSNLRNRDKNSSDLMNLSDVEMQEILDIEELITSYSAWYR